MSREKNKVTKRMSPENSHSENHKLAQFGEFWGTPQFQQAWFWKYRLAFSGMLEASKRKKKEAIILREIGKTVGEAIAKGNSRYLESLAKAVKFVDERFDWNVTTPDDLIQLYRFDLSKFKPVDKLRMLIIHSFYFRHGGKVEAAKHSRKTFMQYIEAQMPDAINERTFDRACRAVGIRWGR